MSSQISAQTRDAFSAFTARLDGFETRLDAIERDVTVALQRVENGIADAAREQRENVRRVEEWFDVQKLEMEDVKRVSEEVKELIERRLEAHKEELAKESDKRAEVMRQRVKEDVEMLMERRRDAIQEGVERIVKRGVEEVGEMMELHREREAKRAAKRPRLEVSTGGSEDKTPDAEVSTRTVYTANRKMTEFRCRLARLLQPPTQLPTQPPTQPPTQLAARTAHPAVSKPSPSNASTNTVRNKLLTFKKNSASLWADAKTRPHKYGTNPHPYLRISPSSKILPSSD